VNAAVAALTRTAASARLRTGLALWRLGLQDALQYRVEGIIWFLFDVLPPLMMVFLWLAAFEGTPEVAGYSLAAMLSYTLGVMVLRNLVTPHMEWAIDYDVRQGNLSSYLLKPFDTWGYWFFTELAWRAWRTVLVTPVLLACILFLAPWLEGPRLGRLEVVGLFASLALAYLVCFLFKLNLGFTCFWLTDVTGVSALYDVVVWVFGGVLLPIELLPEGLQTLARMLPFQYIYAFPLSIYLGRVSGEGIVAGLAMQLGWAALLWLLAQVVWKQGLRRYEAVGG